MEKHKHVERIKYTKDYMEIVFKLLLKLVIELSTFEKSADPTLPGTAQHFGKVAKNGEKTFPCLTMK